MTTKAARYPVLYITLVWEKIYPLTHILMKDNYSDFIHFLKVGMGKLERPGYLYELIFIELIDMSAHDYYFLWKNCFYFFKFILQ